jgi:hypothetical protein
MVVESDTFFDNMRGYVCLSCAASHGRALSRMHLVFIQHL